MHRSSFTLLLTLAALAACGPRSPSVTVPAPAPTGSEVPVAAPAPAGPTKDYPASRRDAIVDKLHGVDVADPYRWLEDPAKPDVAAWMKAEDDYARGRIAKLPGRDKLAARLRELFYYDAVSAPLHFKDRFFYSRKHKDREKRVVYWKTGETGKENVLLDPNTWSTDGSAGLKGWSVSWDGKYAAYNVSEHNADESTMHVLDVATGKQLPDVIPGTRFTGASWL